MKHNTVIQLSDSLKKKTAAHPCFTPGAHDYARLHLPVAPKCNIQCNYCSRRFSCVNESRPGVTSEVLSPVGALRRFLEVRKAVPNLTVVGISGPGDPLANIDEVLETLRLVRYADQAMTFCLSTNGLMLPRYAQALYEAGVSHFTVTMNALDPVIGAKIYRYINGDGMIYTGVRGAGFLIERQLAGLQALRNLDVVCKVNIVAIKGINDTHIEAIAERVNAYGVAATNIMPLIPVEGTPLARNPVMDASELKTLRDTCAKHVPQMYHCRQCRADAVGMLGKDLSQSMFGEKTCCHRKEIG